MLLTKPICYAGAVRLCTLAAPQTVRDAWVGDTRYEKQRGS
jgi:hypothetical protein